MIKREFNRGGDRIRPDGRKALLVYMRPDLIKRLKVEALTEGRPAYVLTEEAVSDWLARRTKGRRARG
jgi:hypothetical protein